MFRAFGPGFMAVFREKGRVACAYSMLPGTTYFKIDFQAYWILSFVFSIHLVF